MENKNTITIKLDKNKDCMFCIHFNVCSIYEKVSKIFEDNWNFIDTLWGDMLLASICKSYQEKGEAE